MKANEVCTQPSWTPRLHQTQIWKISVFMNLVPGAAPVKMVFVQPIPSIPALETEGSGILSHLHEGQTH